jgi:hypothetical protein
VRKLEVFSIEGYSKGAEGFSVTRHSDASSSFRYIGIGIGIGICFWPDMLTASSNVGAARIFAEIQNSNFK